LLLASCTAIGLIPFEPISTTAYQFGFVSIEIGEIAQLVALSAIFCGLLFLLQRVC
jgi:hypothetical protein